MGDKIILSSHTDILFGSSRNGEETRDEALGR